MFAKYNRLDVIVAFICVYATTWHVCRVSASYFSVARAVPATHVALNSTPTLVISGVSRVHCLKECLRSNCPAFNFGDRQCELLDKYLCEDIEVLTSRPNYRYFDVETDTFVLKVDDYRSETACLVSNRCSPKCWLKTTTRMPATLGNVGDPCTVDTDCTSPNADCRNGDVCTCIAGWSHLPATNSCVTACPGGYGTTYSKTTEYYILDNNLVDQDNATFATCKALCETTTGCVSMEHDEFNRRCVIANVTLSDVNPATEWKHDDPFIAYYQRNCA